MNVIRHWAGSGSMDDRATMLRRFVLVTMLSLLIPASARCQFEDSEKKIDTAELVIEASAGWGGTVDQGRPVAVSFLLTNHSDQMIDGRLTLSDPTYGFEVDLGEVFVAPATSRRIASIQAMENWFECYATLSGDGKVLWRRELPLNTGRPFLKNVNYALFVDDGGRALQLPGSAADPTTLGPSELQVAGESGFPVECLTAKTWQVPNHPGPLMSVKAMIFREGADAEALNRLQWEAVAEWMCQGGTVFVHSRSREIIDRLKKFSPLAGDSPVQAGEFTIRHVGLGAIYEYSQPLVSSEGAETRNLIAEHIALLTGNPLSSLVGSGFLHHSRRGGQADRNRILVVGFFGIYTVLSGLVAIVLFRMSQRKIGIYTVVVVSGACVLSGLLGWVLRYSQGDVTWMTVTQSGAGGAVQVARVEVQSAGGRNTQVAVSGENVDLQFTGQTRRRYYWDARSPQGFPPFTWQPNQAKGQQDTYQVNVTMTPWGNRRLHATGFKRGFPRLDFGLTFHPSPVPVTGLAGPDQPPSEPLAGEPVPEGESAAMLPSQVPSGEVTLKIVNRLPYDLIDCQLIIGVTQSVPGQPAGVQQLAIGQPGRPQPMPVPLQTTVTGIALTDVYHMGSIPGVVAGSTLQTKFPLRLQPMRNQWEFQRSWRGGSMMLPRLSRLGTASAWIVGQVSRSSNLTIDEEHSDFVPDEGLHLYIQEIRPEDIPEAFLFQPATSEAAAVPEAEIVPEAEVVPTVR
jgi:hypothetical protein